MDIGVQILNFNIRDDTGKYKLIHNTKIMTNTNKVITLSLSIIVVLGVFAFQPFSKIDTGIFSAKTASAFDGGGSGGSTGGGGGYDGGYGGDSGCCGGGGGYDGPSPDPSPDPTPVTPVVYPAKCVSLTASRTTVPHGGANVTLTWATQNASYVTLSGYGSVSGNGSKTVFVNSNTTFVLTASKTGSGDGGISSSDTCTVTVKVQPPVTVPATCDAFTSNKTSLPYGGGNVILTWATTNATSVSIDNGVGTVAADGSKSVFVPSTRTYTLTAVGTGGNDTCTVTVTVQPPVDDLTPRCDYLNVSDNDVEEGDRVTLSWGTTNANRVTISPNIGDVANDGSTTVTVNDDTTYTLRARNLDNGQEDTCTVTVRVDEDEDDDDDRRTPRCELDISDDKVKRGERVTLSWETTYVDDVRIRDDRGNTIFDTDDYSRSDRKRYFDGSIDLIINQSTEFTLTAGGVDGGSKTCRVDVDVDDIAIYEKRDQGYVIALASVPYTGFEAGTFLTFLFYAILTLWALFVAYILVIKKSSIFGFSLYGQASMNETDLENRKKVEALVAKYAGTNSK